MKTRFLTLFAVLITALLLAACEAVPTEEQAGLSAESAAEGAADASAESSAMEAMPERMPYYDVELEGYEPLTSAPALFDIVEMTEETVTVRHQYGETTIPRNPQRVVTEMNTGEIMVSLGVMPVGYIAFEDQGISPILAEAAPDMVFLPVVDGPNYEQIVALDPDLIIGSWMMGTDGNEEHYELLSAIAPTLTFNDWPGSYWQDSTRQVAMLFDRQKQAEAVIADYDAFVQETRERIAPIFGDETVSPLLFFGPTPWLYTPRYAYDDRVVPEDSTGWLYHELGLTPGDEIAELIGSDMLGLSNVFLEISGEQLPEMTADHLVVFPNGYSGAEGISEGYTEYLESPIWATLPAVQAGNVYAITGVNKSRGYYTKKDNMRIFADIVTGASE
ncbi:MAG: iron-siderophore ABC transporter substrate-binding protein [Chloroflexota bacterium]